MTRGEARWDGVPPTRAGANSPELLMRMACAGAGITAVVHHFAGPYVMRGELTPLLLDWEMPKVPVWAVFPGRRLMPARTRVLLDALQAGLSAPECRSKSQAGASVPQQAGEAVRPGLAV